MVRALAEAMFSPDGEVSPARMEAFVDDVDAFVSPASKTLRFGLAFMLDLLRWSPLFFGTLRTFEALDVEGRLAHLHRLERSKVRQFPLLVVGYKTILSMLFYEDEEEQKNLGYPGPERKRWRSLPIAPASSASSASSGDTR